MNYLLVQSCSATKQKVEQPVPAIELYDGYFYRIIKNSAQYEDGCLDIDLRIISAKHGLLRPNNEISYYEQRMNTERARELRGDIVSELKKEIEDNDYKRVIVNLGKDYQEAITGLSEAIDERVLTIEGSGIGEKGHILKRFLNGDTDIIGGEC
jgi:cytoplasmic iron level regulating protein YaaA (DUF328/UPF0246 family)